MSTHANMVKMTVTSVASAGVGTITLGAAVAGHLHANVQITANATVDIRIDEGNDFEVCRNCAFTYSATPTSCTVDRGTLESGTNGTSRVAFTSAAVVSVVATAASGTRWDHAANALSAATPPTGLTLSNNATDAANDIDIAVGAATVTDGSAWYLASLSSALVKQLDAAWAVGTNAGGLDTGSEANSTWYHVWLIQRSDTGVVDVLFSTSATAPTMPTNYDRKRRIGAIYNDSTGAIRAFTQYQNQFLWLLQVLDVNVNSTGTSAVLRTLSVPTGLRVEAIMSVAAVDTSFTAATYIAIQSPSTTDAAAAFDNSQLFINNGSGVSAAAGAGQVRAVTDTSARIRSRLSQADADIYLRIKTDGWIDPRGNT